MKDKIRVLVSEEVIDARIRQLGEQISHDYDGEEIFMVVILRGAVFFGCELAKRITVPVTMDFIRCSSYGSGTTSSGKIEIIGRMDIDMSGKNVILVEDIIDTGNTLKFLEGYFKSANAKSIRICTLLDKPERRKVAVETNYNGFVIPDEFVVGYGLDYDQKYRNLPYIGVIEN